MNLSEFRRILLQVFLLPMIALLVMAGALYLLLSIANNTVRRIQQSDAHITQLTIINKLMSDEESGLRGYQITSDKLFLQPYTAAQYHLDRQFADLESLPGRSPEQRSYILRILLTHRQWQDSFAAPVIAIMQAGGNTDAVDLNLRGKQLTDSIREDMNSLIHLEEQAREDRIRLWQTQNSELLIVLIILALGLGIAIGLFTRRRLHDVSHAYRQSLDNAQRRAESIFASEQKLRTTLASIGDGVIACDGQGHITMMNPVAEELTGWTLQEAAGLPLEQVFAIVNEDTHAPLENPVSRVTRLNRIVGLENHTALLRKDGTEISIADSGSPIRNHLGEITGAVLVFRDVTVEKKTQNALLANEKFVVAGRLAATIAHEIHNPLDSVSNLLYLIRTGASQDEARQFMSMAEQELARVTQISRAMLGLYRESKAPVQINLGDTLHEILLLLERRLGNLKIIVDADLPPDICVFGFPAELRQVFTNLITNAAEAATPGGHIVIRLSARTTPAEADGRRTEPGAIIEISDDGPGITAEVQGHLFQPFFTTKGEQGTGLGLWVSRGIINKHGGTIDLTSDTANTSHGTTVTVFLAARHSPQISAD